MNETRRRRSLIDRGTARRSLVGLAVGAALFSACGGSASVQDRAGEAVNAFIADDDTLADADFDADCVTSAAAGLTDEVAQEIVDDDGRIDFDVDDQDRDDVYDFYNCADERDLARAIESDQRDAVSADCLEDIFEEEGASEYLNDVDGDDPSRLGDFDNVTTGQCGDDCCEPVPPPDPPETTLPPVTLPIATTVPPTTAPPTTTPPTTTPPVTTPPSTAPPSAPPTTSPSAPGITTTDEYAMQGADFLNDDPAVSDAVGGDVIGVVCTAPSGTTIGTNYLCFGEAATYGPIEFTVEIDGVESFLVIAFQTAPSATKIVFIDELVIGLIGEDLQVDQVCVREIADGLSEADVQIVVDNIDAPEFPDGLSFDEEGLTTLLIGCVS